MYEEVYSEWLVKCKAPAYIKTLKVLVIVLLPFAALATLVFWFGFIILLALVAAYFGLKYLSQKEYEYIFVAGDIAFDRILGAQFRKRRMLLHKDDIEQIAPWEAGELSGIRNKPGMKIWDFSSQEANAKCYGIIYHKNGETGLLKFEPNEKMLQDIKKTLPRKIII